jgi:hypothetical protein
MHGYCCWLVIPAASSHGLGGALYVVVKHLAARRPIWYGGGTGSWIGVFSPDARTIERGPSLLV